MSKEKKQADSTIKTNKVDINSIEWNDYVLGLLSEDEKIDGNPTTDGLRRIFEIALNCIVVESVSTVVQSPDPNNEKRATVVHSIGYVLKSDDGVSPDLNLKKVVSGAADVYWGNCDKVYRNHPVAVAETRAEGRALRRGLKLRKVVAAEEIAKEIDDNIDGNSVNNISTNQINFIDVLSKRLNINVRSLLALMNIEANNINMVTHESAVAVVRELSKFQQNLDQIPKSIIGYDSEWRIK
jgi:hypothetical protein